jgi:pteridine reductase
MIAITQRGAMLDKRVAIVTGGARRIGRAVALALADAGAAVCVHHGHSPDEAAETVAEVERRGGRACAVQADLAQPLAAAEAIVTAARSLGGADVLVNSAAIFEAGDLLGTSEAHWDRHFAINLKAPFFLTQAFVRALGDRPGDVINVVDWRGTRPGTGYPAYTQTKAGLVAQTRTLAQELAPRVRVNAVAPGAVLRPDAVAEEDHAARLAGIPLRKGGTPADVAAAILYLLGAGFVTGEVLHVSGGEQL